MVFGGGLAVFGGGWQVFGGGLADFWRVGGFFGELAEFKWEL